MNKAVYYNYLWFKIQIAPSQSQSGNRQQATGNRQQATGNYTHLLNNRVNNPIADIFSNKAFTPKNPLCSHFPKVKGRVTAFI